MAKRKTKRQSEGGKLYWEVGPQLVFDPKKGLTVKGTPDPINPSHYRQGGIELADVIDAWDLDRWETAAVQYIFRAAKSANKLKDYQKANWYIQRLIARARRANV